MNERYLFAFALIILLLGAAGAALWLLRRKSVKSRRTHRIDIGPRG